MHVGARLGRIRDDPDNDENYCSPGQDLRYQSFSPPPSREYLCLQMPSLAEVTGMAGLRVLRGPGYQPLFGCWRVDLATASARSIAPPWWADASADLHRIFGQRGCQGGSPDGPLSIAHSVHQLEFGPYDTKRDSFATEFEHHLSLEELLYRRRGPRRCCRRAGPRFPRQVASRWRCIPSKS